MRIEPTEAGRAAFKETLQPLLTADRRTFDVAEWLVFYEVLHDVPLNLLQRAVFAMAREPRRFPFRPGDIRAAAEACRKQLLAEYPHELCSDCRNASGFVPIVDERGVERMRKCPCFDEYRRRMASMGVTERPVLQLTAPDEERAS